MTLNYVTLTLDLYDGQGNYPVSGLASFTPSAVLTDAGVEIIGQQPIVVSFRAGALPAAKLLATDNSGPLPAGWTWSVSFSGITGAPAGFSFSLPYSGGATQNLSALTPVATGSTALTYVPAPVLVPAPTGATATDTPAITTAISKLTTIGYGTLLFQDGTYQVDSNALVIRNLSNFTVKGTGATVIQLAPNRSGQYNTNGDLAVIADCTDFSVQGIRFDWNRDTVAPMTPLSAAASSGQPSVTVAAGNGSRYLAGQRLQVYGGLGSGEQSLNDTAGGPGLTISSITPGGGSGGGDLITFTSNLANSYAIISSTAISDGFGPYAYAGAHLTPYQTGFGYSVAGRTGLYSEDTQNALHLLNCQRFLIDGCEARNTWESPIKLGTGFDAQRETNGCSQGIISNCRTQHGYDQGISVWFSDYITVTGNKCQASGWAGISFSHSMHSAATGNISTGNLYSGTADIGKGSGIATEGGIGITISGNVCKDNGYAGILMIQSPPALFSVTTTITAPATAGATTLTVASGGGFEAGSSFTIYDSAHRLIRETIYVASVSGTTVTLSSALVNSYTSGSTVTARFGEGNRVTGNVCLNQVNGAGIKAQYQTAICLSGNECSGNGRQVETNSSTGIWIDSMSDGAVIEGNTCRNNSDDGIFLGSLQHVTVKGNGVLHSGAPATSKSGIKATGLLDSIIEGNRCAYNSNNGISLETDGTNLPTRVQVIGNQAYNNSQRGIIAGDGGSGLTVTENKCAYNSQQGITLQGVSRAIVTGNQCANNSQDGVLLNNNGGGTSCTGILVKGNMLYDDQGSPTQTWGFRDVCTASAAFLQDNIVSGNTGALSLTSGDVLPGPAAYDTAVKADSPLIWWKMADASGSGTAADSSGNSHAGTATSVTFAQPGAMIYNANETSGLFNGTTSNVSVTYTLGAQAAVSVECWANCNGTLNEGGARLLANSHTDGDNKGFQLRVQGLTVKADFGNGTTFATATAGSLPSTGWTHLVATFDSTTIRLYVNGYQAATALLSGSMAAGAATGISLGYNLTYAGDFFTGYLTQAAIYTSALSAARVLTHYMAGAF